jgi:tyrosyl-tRNA synthetase
MSISDELMWKYWLLLTDRSEEDIDNDRCRVDEGVLHPMDVKKALAATIVGEFHSAEQASSAKREFERVFSSRHLPQEIPEVSITPQGGRMLVSKVLVEGGLAASNSEARRLIQQGGVKIDGEAVRDIKAEVETVATEPVLLQVGKRRFARVRFTSE